MDQLNLFFSRDNINYLVGVSYRAHTAGGGSLAPGYFQHNIPLFMRTWPRLPDTQFYEAADGDPLSKLALMNRDFLRDYSCPTGTLSEVKHSPDTVEGYRQRDTEQRTPVTVSYAQFARGGRPLTLQQKMHSRNVDTYFARPGRSHVGHGRNYDMSDIHEAVDRPYATPTTLDADPLYNGEL